jgi:subtilase family serine protease
VGELEEPRPLSSADPSTDVGFRVYLGWNDPAAVASLAAAVSDPSSASYRQYLTPAKFRQQFAPSQAQVAAVQSCCLRGHRTG